MLNGGYKPTYNWGGTTLYEIPSLEGSEQRMGVF